MPTIKDVARLAGVGVGTASRVISGNGSVAPATAERVREAIAQLNFRPSHAARSLLSGSSQMVGVFIPLLKGTFYTPILQVIDSTLRDNGRHMVVAFGQGSGDERLQTLEGLQFLIDRGCDGLVVMSNAVLEDDIRTLRKSLRHILVLNRHFPRIKEACFHMDHVRGGVVAAQALLQAGHRQFAVIAGPATSPDNVERVGGFMGELARNGIDPTRVRQLCSDFSPEGGWACAKELLDSGDKFTALFCANDESAVGALSYFQQHGISVPGDISVVGYDDTASAEYSAPPLSSVHLPLREMTLNGLNWLLNKCYGSALPVVREFPISMTWRSSVGPPKGTARRRA